MNQYSLSSSIHFFLIIVGSRGNIFLQACPYNWGYLNQCTLSTYCTCLNKKSGLDKPNCARYRTLPQGSFGHDKLMFWFPITHFSFSELHWLKQKKHCWQSYYSLVWILNRAHALKLISDAANESQAKLSAPWWRRKPEKASETLSSM